MGFRTWDDIIFHYTFLEKLIGVLCTWHKTICSQHQCGEIQKNKKRNVKLFISTLILLQRVSKASKTYLMFLMIGWWFLSVICLFHYKIYVEGSRCGLNFMTEKKEDREQKIVRVWNIAGCQNMNTHTYQYLLLSYQDHFNSPCLTSSKSGHIFKLNSWQRTFFIFSQQGKDWDYDEIFKIEIWNIAISFTNRGGEVWHKLCWQARDWGEGTRLTRY